MDRRHQDALTNRLEDAFMHGVAHVSWQELYLWYGVQKIAARTLRDLSERWRTVTEGACGPLMQVEGRDGIFVFGERNARKVDPNDSTDSL